LDQQEVEREPDRSSPSGVAAERPIVRQARSVGDLEVAALDVEPIGSLEVGAGERPHP
jgi:hypothetical protein